MPLFKLLLGQVSQALEVSNVLTFKGQTGFQRMLQKARYVIRQFQWDLSISLSASKAEKPSPWELIYFKCSVYAQVILKTNSKYPEKLKIIVFQPKKFLIGRHMLFSALLIYRNEWKKVYLKLPFLEAWSLFSKPPAKIYDVIKWPFSCCEILQSGYPSCTWVGYSILVAQAVPLGMHLSLQGERISLLHSVCAQGFLRLTEGAPHDSTEHPVGGKVAFWPFV